MDLGRQDSSFLAANIEREVIASLLRWYPTPRTVIDTAAEVYRLFQFGDGHQQLHERDLMPEYLVVRRTLLRLEQRGEVVRSKPPQPKPGFGRRRGRPAARWMMKEVAKTQRR